MATFHHDRFSYSASWRLMLVGMLAFACGDFFFMPIIYSLTGAVLSKGTEMFIDFIISELIPVFLVGRGFAVWSRGCSLNTSFWPDALRWLITWVKRFAHDFWKHKGLIILTAVIAIFLQVYIRQFATWFLYDSNKVMQSENTALMVKMVKQNPIGVLSTIIIAPVAEELVFRFWLVNIIRYWLAKLIHLPRISDYAAIFFSALMFAVFHDPSSISIIMLSGYMVPAFILQGIQQSTHSLTAPIMVHSMTNLIIISAILFSSI